MSAEQTEGTRVYDRLVGVDAEGHLPPVVAAQLKGDPGEPGEPGEPGKPGSPGEPGPPSVDLDAGPHPRFAIIGDSHADQAWSAQAGQTWWQIATQYAGGILTPNGAQGHGGWTLRQLIDGQDGTTPLVTALADHPDYLIIEGAANSAAAGRTAGQYETDLREIITQARARGARPVVIFPPALFEGETETWAQAFASFRETAESLCEGLHVPYWDIWDAYPQSPASWSSGDSDHMNASGHAAYGTAAGKFLKETFGSWGDIACVPLTDTPWGDTTLSPWGDGTAEIITAPEGSMVRGQAVKLAHPGPKKDNAGVKHVLAAQAGQKVRVTYAYRITKGDSSDIRHGLQFFWQRKDTWAVETPVALIRAEGAEGRGGFEFTVPDDYTGDIMISAALSADADATPVEAIVGNLVVS